MSLDTRDIVRSRLRVDLIGPQAPEEVIADRPSDRYLTGILFPIGRVPEAEDETLGVGESEPGETIPDDGRLFRLHFALHQWDFRFVPMDRKYSWS